jgi:predicted  nucleic acid-binding Zn-ribbon protein
MPLPLHVQNEIKKLNDRLLELDTAKRNLENNQIQKRRELEEAIAKAKCEGRKVVIEKVKTVIPKTPPTFFKPALRAVLRDVQKVIEEEEKKLSKKA